MSGFDAAAGRRRTHSSFATAIVTDNSDPDGLGRVKVQYAWSGDSGDSYWARVVTFMAGNGFGGVFLPEVGDEVLVAFIDGDIERPVVVGSLWNQQDVPPYGNSDGKNDIRSIKSRGGHEILFDDNGDTGGKLSIKTSGGHSIELDDTSGGEKIVIKDKNGSSIEIDSAQNKIALKSSMQISIESNMIDIKADGILTLQGSLVKIN